MPQGEDGLVLALAVNFPMLLDSDKSEKSFLFCFVYVCFVLFVFVVSEKSFENVEFRLPKVGDL